MPWCAGAQVLAIHRQVAAFRVPCKSAVGRARSEDLALQAAKAGPQQGG